MLGVPIINKDYSILGYILGFPCFGKLPYVHHIHLMVLKLNSPTAAPQRREVLPRCLTLKCMQFTIMEKKMEATMVYWGFIGIMEKKMEATMVYWGFIGIMCQEVGIR